MATEDDTQPEADRVKSDLLLALLELATRRYLTLATATWQRAQSMRYVEDALTAEFIEILQSIVPLASDFEHRDQYLGEFKLLYGALQETARSRGRYARLSEPKLEKWPEDLATTLSKVWSQPEKARPASERMARLAYGAALYGLAKYPATDERREAVVAKTGMFGEELDTFDRLTSIALVGRGGGAKNVALTIVSLVHDLPRRVVDGLEHASNGPFGATVGGKETLEFVLDRLVERYTEKSVNDWINAWRKRALQDATLPSSRLELTVKLAESNVVKPKRPARGRKR